MLRNRNLSTVAILAACGMAHSPFSPHRHMIVKSPLFNEISGKLGGAVGMTSRFGMILRGRVSGSNPQTSPQYGARQALSSLASIFSNDLSDAQRLSWEQLADDTDGAASGLSLFVRANSLRIQARSAPILPLTTLAIVETAPVSVVASFSETPTAVIIDASAKTLAFTIPAAPTDPWADAGGAMVIWCSRPQRASRNTRIHPFSLVANVDGDDVVASQSLSLATGVLARVFASLDAGEVCYVKWATITPNGQRSADFVQRVTVVA